MPAGVIPRAYFLLLSRSVLDVYQFCVDSLKSFQQCIQGRKSSAASSIRYVTAPDMSATRIVSSDGGSKTGLKGRYRRSLGKLMTFKVKWSISSTFLAD